MLCVNMLLTFFVSNDNECVVSAKRLSYGECEDSKATEVDVSIQNRLGSPTVSRSHNLIIADMAL